MSDKDADPSPPVTAGPPPGLPDPEATSLPPPAFEPLFTLLTNASTGVTVHPHVRYLFSDDDTSALACPDDDPGRRTVLVDLAPAGSNAWHVQWASSLSPDFALTASHLAVQRADDANESDASMMLRLEGVEREPPDANTPSRPTSLPSSGSGAMSREDVDLLADEFKRRIEVLKKVVREGEKRRDIMQRQSSSLPGPKAGDENEPPGGRESALQGAMLEEESPGSAG
ncbi:hypothetical protein NOR_07071 [Metarhizium rileyi]|uniref:Uncharacterized protein n=1 Tax=Metarhizium rileyi (strain RCEF 4871) TaxID=1649241 RepID=A0A166Z9P6_METRR|nr:hypothetical protein NOR_07071 [Metarhizium rileyi RCEF 4871]